MIKITRGIWKPTYLHGYGLLSFGIYTFIFHFCYDKKTYKKYGDLLVSKFRVKEEIAYYPFCKCEL